MSQAFRRICLALIPCLLLACTDYRIVRPTTEAGSLCAAKCDRTRAICDRSAEAEAASEAFGCEGNARAEEICSRHEGEVHDRCMAAESSVCVNPAPEYGPCTSEWEMCVLSCGGRMVDE
jgi:hypothetical protein